jgi:hypothetical protein
LILNDYLGGLPPSQKQTFDNRLEVLQVYIALTQQCVHNIRGESRLPVEFWRDLVEALIAVPPDVDKLRTAIVQVCRSYTHRGGAIPSPWPIVYGRVTGKEQFCQYLRDEGYLDTLTEARQFVSRLTGYSAPDCRTELRGIYLGKYAMWATFDPVNPSQDPFLSLPTQAEELSKRLGLIQAERRRDMVLLVYTLPTGIEPYFPTIADSYAGEGWLLYFRPAIPGALYGLTHPWAPDAKPCPEVIHKPITGETLHSTVRIAKGR